MTYPQFPGLQPPPPNPGIPGRTQTAVWVAAVFLFAAVAAGVLLALSSARHPGAGTHDQAFLSVVHADIPTYDHTPDADLIHMGHTACGVLNAGGSLLDVVQESMTYGGLSSLEAAQFVGASIGAYCPDMAP